MNLFIYYYFLNWGWRNVSKKKVRAKSLFNSLLINKKIRLGLCSALWTDRNHKKKKEKRKKSYDAHAY